VNYQQSQLATIVFASFVSFVLFLSFHLARKTKSSSGYFAAGGKIHWGVNGIAFAGDYLSAASFLGIAGMIATAGYDGFLYSVGYLAGWIVALFVVAEPMKKLGKYTFADALDAKFNSKSIRLTAALSTLVVSVFYLIPQMVGAGILVTPLLGLAHHWGVILVGTIVIIIVATAGMTSTTWVQFIKGGMLLIFSTVLVVAVLARGLSTKPSTSEGLPYHDFVTLEASAGGDGKMILADNHYSAPESWRETPLGKAGFVQLMNDEGPSIWKVTDKGDGKLALDETLYETILGTPRYDGIKILYNGAPRDKGRFFQVGHMSEVVVDGKSVEKTGPLGPLEFLSVIRNSSIVCWDKKVIADGGDKHTIYYQTVTPGSLIMRPGIKFKVDEDRGATAMDKWNFVSLMMALFFGTAALPHILIRYYTVPNPAAARKSTIVAIAAIGFFYVLTLYMGLGAMVNGVIDITDNNMSAPLLAKSFGISLFAVISAIAFATVLGTVSGLIVAASGAVAHDIMNVFLDLKMTDTGQVLAGKVVAIIVGAIAIWLGIQYKGMNVSYLVGWAFAVAASANLPAIVMMLFWKRTTAKGVAASIIVGVLSSVGLILFSPDMYERYGWDKASAPFALNNPGVVSIPLSFLALVIVSLLTSRRRALTAADEALR